MLAASLATANSAGVTSFTFLSVVWALRMTETSSWKVDPWSCAALTRLSQQPRRKQHVLPI